MFCNKTIKLINIFIIIIFVVLLTINYEEYGKSLHYSLLGLFPFSIIIAGLLACFIRKWIIIIIPYITIMVYDYSAKDLVLFIVGIYLILLIGYVYLNHIICFNKK